MITVVFKRKERKDVPFRSAVKNRHAEKRNTDSRQVRRGGAGGGGSAMGSRWLFNHPRTFYTHFRRWEQKRRENSNSFSKKKLFFDRKLAVNGSEYCG